MIISHEHRFIFLHCRKVAGGSIESYLSQFLDDKDFMKGSLVDRYKTYGIPPNKAMWMDLVHPAALAYFLYHVSSRSLAKPWRHVNRMALISALNRSRALVYPPLFTAASIKAFAPNEWDKYYKFCFVRNPYDLAVSDYKWRTKRIKHGRYTFKDFLREIEGRQFSRNGPTSRYSNWPACTIRDQICVDYVGRYENLYADLAEALGEIGLPFKEELLPHTKNSTHPGDYRKWYGKEEKELVTKLYKKEIDAFGYSF